MRAGGAYPPALMMPHDDTGNGDTYRSGNNP